jgi:hypothetical protein
MPAAYGMRSKSNESEIFDRDMRVAGTALGRTMGRTGKHDVLGMDRR